jgi:hypothetical protein
VAIINERGFLTAYFDSFIDHRIRARVAEELAVFQNLFYGRGEQVKASSFPGLEVPMQRPAVMNLRGASRSLAPED